MLLRWPPGLANSPVDKRPFSGFWSVAPIPNLPRFPKESLPKTERSDTPFPQSRRCQQLHAELLIPEKGQLSLPGTRGCNSCQSRSESRPAQPSPRQLPRTVHHHLSNSGTWRAAPNNRTDLRPPPRPRSLVPDARDGGADLVTEPHLLPANSFAL